MEPPCEYAPGERVRNKYVFQPLTVAEMFAPSFRYRYRCMWEDADGHRRQNQFKADNLTPDDRTPA
jgi:uncharacterized protein YodC (DUF2158 family)